MSTAMPLQLGAALDIANAANLKAQLDSLLAQEGELLLDGASVERLDAAGLQLLASWFRHCDKHQRICRWSHSSAVLRESAAGLGLACVLQLHENPSKTNTEGQ